MTTCSTPNSQTIESQTFDHSQIAQDVDIDSVTKTSNNQLWFFLGIAPLAVLSGWCLVGVCLTGNWVWEFPMGLMFAFMGSMTGLASTRFRL